MDEEIFEAEVIEAPSSWANAIPFRNNPLAPAIGVVALSLIFVSSMVIVFMDFSEPIEYELIGFDQDRTRGYTQDLVDLGHPEWEGRMSGSAEEQATADYIMNLFDSLGYQTELNSYEVPMHSINSEPSLRVCIPGGLIGTAAPCSPLDQGATFIEFEHRVDYVIQGFSGQSDINFGDNFGVTYLGDGSDDSLWASAAGTVGIVDSGGSIGGNTGIMTKAIENDLVSIIRVNTDYNCGKIEGDDCVPIFKGTGFEEIKEANGGSVPTDMAFIALSKDAGEDFRTAMIENEGRMEMMIDVTNDEELTIRVPCGTMYGKSSEVVIAGGHHDTVYHAQGAVDDSSGTASVLEMATQMAAIFAEKGEPERTVKFCTWGGEEEGLWGSKAFVEENAESLAENLRLYINLDMNHVDIDMDERGNSVRLFGNDVRDVQHISDITEQYKSEFPQMASKYVIDVFALDGAKGESDGMPYNSDHGPFVYDLGDDIRGRAVVCYGSGSWEYHTYLDDMSRFNEESLGISVTIYGSYINYLAYSTNT